MTTARYPSRYEFDSDQEFEDAVAQYEYDEYWAIEAYVEQQQELRN